MKSQYKLYEENIDILTTNIELEEQICKDHRHILSREDESLKLIYEVEAIVSRITLPEAIANIQNLKIKRMQTNYFWLQVIVSNREQNSND